jgi:curli biogenesis system outer membrane secretion channel CsgG
MRKCSRVILIIVLVAISCGGGPSVFSQKKSSNQPYKTLALLPFDNYSGREDAGKQVSDAFLVELLKRGLFHIVEPGETERVMKEERIRSASQIDIATARLLKEKLSADYVLIGAVNEYDYLKDGERDVPLVGFDARLLDTSNGQIVWAANHSKRGDDGELIFGWRSVTSLTKLTQICVKDVISSIKFEQ